MMNHDVKGREGLLRLVSDVEATLVECRILILLLSLDFKNVETRQSMRLSLELSPSMTTPSTAMECVICFQIHVLFTTIFIEYIIKYSNPSKNLFSLSFLQRFKNV